MLGEAGDCSLIFVTTDAPLSSGVIILRLDAPHLSHVHGGGPRLVELVGVATGTLILHRLHKHGYIYTDNQSVVKQLTARRRMSHSGQRSGVFFALHTWHNLKEGTISLSCLRGHPERREKNRALSTREDWGLYLANLYTPPRADPNLDGSSIWVIQIYIRI